MTGKKIAPYALRPLRMGAAAATGVAILTLILSPPAVAADGSEQILELSSDGIHYAPEGLSTVLSQGGGLVPGESRSDTVWVRNASTQVADFSFAVVNTAAVSGSGLADHLQLGASAPFWSVSASVPPSFGVCTTMIENRTLSAGESVPIDLALKFSSVAPNSTRNQKSSFDMVFLLQDSDGGVPVSPCAPLSAAQSRDTSTGRITVNSGTASHVTTAALPAGPVEQVDPAAPWPADALPQSNVVATGRSPWSWLVLLSAGTFVGILLRRRKSQRRTP